MGTKDPEAHLHVKRIDDTATLLVETESTAHDPNVLIDGQASRTRRVGFMTDGSWRWTINAISATESGNEEGSDYAIYSFNDVDLIRKIVYIDHATGNIGVGTPSLITRLQV